MIDMLKLAVVIAAFAVWVSVHIALVAGLVGRGERGRALAALLVPFLAPYWGARRGMRARAAAWVSLCALYVVARIVASS